MNTHIPSDRISSDITTEQSQLHMFMTLLVPNLGRDVINKIHSFGHGIISELHLINKQSYLMVKEFHKEIFKNVKTAFVKKDIPTLNKIKIVLCEWRFFYLLYDTVQSLIRTECDIESGTNKKPNLIAKAIGEGDLRRVQIAVELGANVSETCYNECFFGNTSPGTPLIASVYNNMLNIAAYLLGKGADPDFYSDPLVNFYSFLKNEFEDQDQWEASILYDEHDFLSGLQYGNRSRSMYYILDRAIEMNTAVDLIYRSVFEGFSNASSDDQIHSIFNQDVAGGIILTYLNPKEEAFSKKNPTISRQEYYRRLFEMRYDVQMPFLRFF